MNEKPNIPKWQMRDAARHERRMTHGDTDAAGTPRDSDQEPLVGGRLSRAEMQNAIASRQPTDAERTEARKKQEAETDAAREAALAELEPLLRKHRPGEAA